MAEFMLDAAGATEAEQRQAMSYLLAQSSTGLARTGVLAGLGVSQTSTASGVVNVAAGAASVQASTLVGVAVLVSNATKPVDVFTSDPVGGLPRNDIVVFDSVTKAITVIVGTPNAVPTDPTVPASACPLARLRHAADATTIPTAAIDDLRVTTRLAGVREPGVSAKGTTNIAGIAGSATAVANAPAVLGDGVRKFKITGALYSLQGTVAGDVFAVYVRNATTLAVLGTFRATIPASLLTDGIVVTATDVPAAGSVTYQIAVQRVIGTGTGTVLADASSPREIIVEQIA